MRSDNNTNPWWWRTGVSAGPDGFLPSSEVLKGNPTPEEFAAALDGAGSSKEDNTEP